MKARASKGLEIAAKSKVTRRVTELQALLYELCQGVQEPEQKLARPLVACRLDLFGGVQDLFDSISPSLCYRSSRSQSQRLPRKSSRTTIRCFELGIDTTFGAELDAAS